MSSQTILALLHQRDELLKRLNQINAQIIQATLDSGASVKESAARSGGKRRKWFERGEMIAMSRKILTRPMAQADLVRGLASAKGYEKTLSSAEKARFASAAYQAIAAALAAKQLTRNKLGQVSARR